MKYFTNAPDSTVTKPSQVAIVGDRLFTDILMANLMGSWSIWVKDGVVQEKSLVSVIKTRICKADAEGDPVLELRESIAKILASV